jgi:hypothetical protein
METMKIQTLIAMLISLAVVSLLAVEPCAAQTLQYSHVHYQSPSPSTRYPTRSSSSLVPIAQLTPQPDPLAPGVYPALPINPITPCYVASSTSTTCSSTSSSTTTTYYLAYISVTGGQGGAITVFPDSSGSFTTTPYLPVTVQAGAHIVVQYVYWSGGGSCPTGQQCPTAAAIDEFDESAGVLGDDLFVTVTVPAGTTPNSTTLTTTGNDNGSVATITNPSTPIQIKAYSSTPGGAFDRWVAGPGGGWTISSTDLTVSQKTDVYALAFYHVPCPSGYTWTSTPTISQCTASPGNTTGSCPVGKVFDANTKTCVPGFLPQACPAFFNCPCGCTYPAAAGGAGPAPAGPPANAQCAPCPPK